MQDLTGLIKHDKKPIAVIIIAAIYGLLAIVSIAVNIFGIISPDFTTNWQTYVVIGMQCIVVICAVAMLFGTKSAAQAAYGALSLMLIIGFILNRVVTGGVISLIGPIIILACLSLIPPSKRYLLSDPKKEESGDNEALQTPVDTPVDSGYIPPHESSGKNQLFK